MGLLRGTQITGGNLVKIFEVVSRFDSKAIIINDTVTFLKK